MMRLQMARRQAGIEEAEYRDMLAHIFDGCVSSTDPRLTNEHWDRIIAFWEAVYFRKLDRKEVKPPGRNAMFQKRGYWAQKNKRGNTSRDRYTAEDLGAQIADAEGHLLKLGYGPHYCAAIHARIGGDAASPIQRRKYLAALENTTAAIVRRLGVPRA
jgi:restriction endonuclease Mrr